MVTVVAALEMSALTLEYLNSSHQRIWVVSHGTHQQLGANSEFKNLACTYKTLVGMRSLKLTTKFYPTYLKSYIMYRF